MKYFLMILVLLIPVHLLAAASMPEQGDSTRLVLQLNHRKTKSKFTIEPGQKVRIRRKNGIKEVGYIEKFDRQTVYLDTGKAISLSEIEQIFLPRVKNKWLIYLGWFSILAGIALIGPLVYHIGQLLSHHPMGVLLAVGLIGLIGGPATTLILLGIIPFVVKQRRFDLRMKFTFELVSKQP